MTSPHSAASPVESRSAATDVAPGDGEADGWHRRAAGWVKADRIAGMLLCLLPVGGLAVPAGIFWVSSWPRLGLLVLAALVAYGLLVCLSFWWTAREFVHAGWRITPRSIEVRRGVVWRRESRVPRSRIQHTDVTQGPLQRRYGIATVVVHTAGTQDATVSVEGLPEATAYEVRDRLLGVRDSDDV